MARLLTLDDKPITWPELLAKVRAYYEAKERSSESMRRWYEWKASW